MAECEYVEYYPDVNTGIEKRFKCDEAEHKSGRCKFHLKGYLQEHRGEIIRLFSKKLRNAKKDFEVNEKPLLCIGYRLPSISLLEDEEEELKLPVYFTNAKFQENLNFSNVVFKREVSFHKTEFFGTINLRDSVFDEMVDFSHSRFLSEDSKTDSFQSTKFNEHADFTHISFKSTDFSLASFSEIQFAGSTFKNKTFFSNVIFSNDTNFRGTWFFDSVEFVESDFKTAASFEDVNFLKFADFSHVHFKNKKDITFNGNISNVSFLDTDIKNINFGNKTSWEILQTKPEKVENEPDKKKRENKDYKIYEERLLEENDETTVNLESIKNIYRDLRDNFDLNLRYEVAGKFFVREMELKRKYKEKRVERRLITTKKPICHRILTLYWLYNILAQYGQSYYRPIYFAIPIIVIGTFFFWAECIEQEKLDSEYICDGPLYAFIRSLSSFIPFFTFTEHPSTLDYALRLALLPILGTFFIALKRKFERKLRH